MVTPGEKKIERTVFTSYFQNGFIEAFMCIFLLELGLPVLFSRSGFGDLQSALIVLPIALALLVVVFLIRKFIIIPRLGHVTFLPERRRRLSILVIIPILTLTANAIVSYFIFENDSMRNIFVSQIPFSLSPIIVFCAAAYFLDMKRLYIYGAIVGVIIPLSKIIETVLIFRDILPGIILFTAFIFFCMATVFFIAFLKKYHVTRDEKVGK
ncbi:MAG: hypothetical protein JW762_14305 [Dehalococcoidales bacterium]|nr:hypothetical protein [Dehalococcoidales bacterium]